MKPREVFVASDPGHPRWLEDSLLRGAGDQARDEAGARINVVRLGVQSRETVAAEWMWILMFSS